MDQSRPAPIPTPSSSPPKAKKMLSTEARLAKQRSDRNRAKTRVNIGRAFQKWRDLRVLLGMKTDPELAFFLLDSYEGGPPTSTPSKARKRRTKWGKRHSTPAPDRSSTDSLSPDRLVDTTESAEENIQSESAHHSPRTLSPASSCEDWKTEPVMDSTDYTGVELRCNLIKSEDIEESIERKNGHGMDRDEKPILFNIKEEEEEEEEGGERQEESEVFACSQCPFVHMEEVKLHQHIEKVHPEEHSRILRDPAGSTESGSPPLQLPNRATRDVGCQTDPPEKRSCGTQLSKETLRNHVRSRGSQASVQAVSVGVGTTTCLPKAPPLLPSKPQKPLRPSKRPHLEVVGDDDDDDDDDDDFESMEVSEPDDSTCIPDESGLTEPTILPLADSTKSAGENIQSESALHSPRALSPACSCEDWKTEPVMDSADYTGAELRSSLIKSEDIEESIERKNGYGMSREEKPILSNIKEEGEEGGERQGEEVKREDGVKVEVDSFKWKEEKESDGDEMEQTSQADRGLKEDGLPDCKKQEEESLPPQVTSCLLNQPRASSPGSHVISSSKGNAGQSEVFACSQCPFAHMEEVKLHQHIEKVHPEEHKQDSEISHVDTKPQSLVVQSVQCLEDWWIPQKNISNQKHCFVPRVLSPASLGEARTCDGQHGLLTGGVEIQFD
ncbi:hypothetical protein SKAU_G00077360 [Synaphobranchus kaupii]|uniref:C2H2-type domain-containing protein n=1 Tax=Synaphobranchus kaupii TaxID=118154 RepID=A0A9Q1G8G2_SYNKA|nr:hypothetical protein SKAU_G00077360 [Synaphobranchus kaupii]